MNARLFSCPVGFTGTIGERLYTAKVYFQTPDLFAWTAVIVAVSAVFEKAFLALVDLLARKAVS